MILKFSEHPGARERHLRRKADNPLFGDTDVSESDVLYARQEDASDLQDFMAEFQKLVGEAVELPSQADSEVILLLKERLDKAYEQASGLPGELDEFKTALRKLIDVIMQSVVRGAGNDPQAQDELEQEHMARETHFALLREPLIVDLLNPESPVAEDELVATLLSESETAVDAALTVFEPEQITDICVQAREMLARIGHGGASLDNALARLAQLEAAEGSPPLLN